MLTMPLTLSTARYTLVNITNLCPALTIIAINCYRTNVPLSIDGDVLFSSEGTTQGDPLAMIFYSIGIFPLIHWLEVKDYSQIWYANDAAACWSLSNIFDWWTDICSLGPGYRY